MRPETGPMVFAGSPRGVYVTGANAFAYARALELLMDPHASVVVRECAAVQVRNLMAMLDRGNEFVDAEVQRMLPFEACAENDTPR